MTTKTDGGPAFPVWELNGSGEAEMTGFGMTLRDYFAAKAMQSIISGSTSRLLIGPEIPNDNQRISIIAYTVADAMLEARDK